MTVTQAQKNRLLAQHTLEEKWPEYHHKLLELLLQSICDAPESIFEGDSGSFIFEAFTDNELLLGLKVYLAPLDYKLTNPFKGS